MEDDDQHARGGKDLYEESTAQNFRNAARQGDISPRFVEKGKSIGKSRRKQAKETSSGILAGVQTKRTVSKSINYICML